MKKILKGSKTHENTGEETKLVNMADVGVVSGLTEKLTSMLADRLLQEASLIISFKEDFEFLCDELVSINCLLNDGGVKRNSASICNWLDKLEYFVYDTVDIVKECSAARKFGNPIFRYRIGRRIKGLKERISNIHESAKYLKYLMSVMQLHAFNAKTLEDQRERSSALIKESHIVGMEHDICYITDLILQKDGPRVISVMGMGGLGKTLLAQHVFKRKRVQQGFDYLVWLALSHSFVVKQVLVEMCRQIKLRVDEQTDEVVIKIHQHLKERRCLLVLDDVWHMDVLEKIGLTLDGKSKIKILLTTRDRKVAEAMPHAHHIQINSLSSEDSMKLFCIHAFPERCAEKSPPNGCVETSPPNELSSFAHRIVEKCSGLPLAIKIIAASMTKVRRLPNDWERTLNRLMEVHAMSDSVMASPRLSYQALPNHLKLCFVYFSVFPKNTQIKFDYLLHAWISEGFTPETTEEAYDVARSYIDELIDRCLLEVSKVSGDGRVKYCKMHDLLHDLALSESHKQTKCLLKTGKEIKEFPVGECVGLRRISLIKNDISTINEAIQCPGLRTLLLWNNIRLRSISASFLTNVRYLAVLDLSQTSIDSLPESVGNLKHLRFLNLSQTKIQKLPKSLTYVRSLQYLDVSQCKQLCELHSGIGEHKSMVYLNVKDCENLKSLPVGISKLICLQSLKGAVLTREKATNSKALQLKDLKSMTRLRQLTLIIDAVSSEDKIPLAEGTFGAMTKMRDLSFKYIHSCSLLHLPEDIRVMQRLEILHLGGCVVPKWIFQLQNLMELKLLGDNDSADYRGLEKIPNLRKLQLSGKEKCVEFPVEFGKRGAFPKLEKFILEDFDCLVNFPSLEEEAIPMLRHLEIKNCRELKDMPEALKRLSNNLKEIKVECCRRWENSLWKDGLTWDLLKLHTIKLTINGYKICWEMNAVENLREIEALRAK